MDEGFEEYLRDLIRSVSQGGERPESEIAALAEVAYEKASDYFAGVYMCDGGH